MTLWGGCGPLFEFVDLGETEIMPNRMWTLSIIMSEEPCSLKWKWRADGLNESVEYRHTELTMSVTIYSTFESSEGKFCENHHLLIWFIFNLETKHRSKLDSCWFFGFMFL